MSDYTPTVEEVRTDYVLAYADRDSSQLLAGAAFDRFIAKVKVDAWDEGYETGCSSPYGTATPSGRPYDPEPNPYRIEGEA